MGGRGLALRRRVALGFWVPLCLLFVGGYLLDRRASYLRTTDLETRLSSCEFALSDLRERLQDLKTVSIPTSRDDFSHVRQIGGASNIPRPRFLASGRSGSWRYADVRLPSGLVRRYYVRDDADRRAVALWVRRISEDVRDDLDGYFAPVVEDADF